MPPSHFNSMPNFFSVVGISTDNLHKLVVLTNLFKYILLPTLKAKLFVCLFNITFNLFIFIFNPTSEPSKCSSLISHSCSSDSLNKITLSANLRWLKNSSFIRIPDFYQSNFLNASSGQAINDLERQCTSFNSSQTKIYRCDCYMF